MNEATGISCPHGTDTGTECPRCMEELENTMLRWTPGELPTHTLERILMDALADLWRDCYRRDNTRARERLFAEKVSHLTSAATNGAIRLSSQTIRLPQPREGR